MQRGPQRIHRHLRVVRDAVVIALDRRQRRAVRPDDGDCLVPARFQRQNTVVLQQHHRLFRGLLRDSRVRGRVHFTEWNLCVQHGARGVEQPQPDACLKQAAQAHVDVRLLDEPRLHGIAEPAVGAAAVGVGAGEQSGLVGMDGVRVRHVRVGPEEVVDGPAVGRHKAPELPVVAQDVDQQQLAAARGRAVQAVVGAHDGVGLRIDDGRAELRQVGVPQVVRRGLHVELVAARLGAGVHGEVLRRGDHLVELRVGALQAADEVHAQRRGQVRVFAVGLLPAPPARIAKDVDVWRPEGQAKVDLVDVMAQSLVVLGASLGRDDIADLV